MGTILAAQGPARPPVFTVYARKEMLGWRDGRRQAREQRFLVTFRSVSILAELALLRGLREQGMPDAGQRRLRLMRHCESLSNAGVATLDARTLPLSIDGHRQAQEIADDWHPASMPDLVVVSPYTRAQQTAQPLIARFPQVMVEHWPVVQEFTYLEQPTNPTTPEQRRPLADAYWLRADMTERQRGAESFLDFWGRVHDFHERSVRCAVNDILVVTHGGFMVAFDAWCSQPQAVVGASLMQRVGEVFRKVPFANGDIIEYELDAAELRWRRRLQN